LVNKIGITGADGFIGKRLVSRLEEGRARVKLFDRKKHFLDDVGSLVDFADGCGVIVHLAGVTKIPDPDVYKTNVLGTVNLLRAVEVNGKKPLLIFPSTAGVYEAARRGLVKTERSKIKPENEYSMSKLLCENLLRFYVSRNVCDALVLRISNVYGSGISANKHSVVATFMELVKSGKTVTLHRGGRQTRDFVHVDDVVDAFVRAIGSEEGGFEVMNISSNEEISIFGLVKLLEEISGDEVKVAYLEDGRGGYWNVSNRKAFRLLGCKPKVSFEKGLRDLWQENYG